ncbi:MAG: hypothetical protein [Microviridae sp.]|nr:MAG: hypothetical protein [Microviridae sp.]
MKLDVFKWEEMDLSRSYLLQTGVVHVRASCRVAVFVTQLGHRVLVGGGYEVKATVSGACSVEAIPIEKNALEPAVFLFNPLRTANAIDGEIFTNAERKPLESGSVLAVTKALRQFQLERKNALQEIRRETANLKKARSLEPSPVAKPVPAPQPAPSPETEVKS